MQAVRVRRLSDPAHKSRFYLDGKRVSRDAYDAAHIGRTTDTYGSRITTRRDGSEVVREFHFIRVKQS